MPHLVSTIHGQFEGNQRAVSWSLDFLPTSDLTPDAPCTNRLLADHVERLPQLPLTMPHGFPMANDMMMPAFIQMVLQHEQLNQQQQQHQAQMAHAAAAMSAQFGYNDTLPYTPSPFQPLAMTPTPAQVPAHRFTGAPATGASGRDYHGI